MAFGRRGLSIEEVAPHPTSSKATDTIPKTIRQHFLDSIANVVKAKPTTAMRIQINNGLIIFCAWCERIVPCGNK
jgi:hypothetical protein